MKIQAIPHMCFASQKHRSYHVSALLKMQAWDLYVQSWRCVGITVEIL